MLLGAGSDAGPSLGTTAVLSRLEFTTGQHLVPAQLLTPSHL